MTDHSPSLLRATGASYFPIALVARLPYAMMVVGVLTLVVAARDSLALGGLNSAMVGIGAACFGPLLGAAADRFGQRPVLLVTGVASTSALGLMAWVVHSPLPGGAVRAAAFLVGASAPQVADRLGSTAAAFDVSAGCAGFCHGLGLASSLVRSGAEAFVLVIGVEQLSRFMDPTDRGTAFIFADGAGAVVVGAAEATGIGPTAWGSDGSKAHVINQTPSCLDSGETHHPVVQMEGTAVFRWAPFAMADVVREALTGAGVAIDDLDAFVPHQANLRITQTLARNIGLPESVAVATDITEAGNTSAASVPLAMEAMLRTGQAQPGGLALLIAFGAGLSYAGQVVTLPPWENTHR